MQGSESTRLDAKAVAVLSFLAQHPNDVVTKEQIISAVWEGAFVSDEVLTTAIWSLRKTLGDDAKEPRYIKTIPRQGYRHRKGRVGCSFWDRLSGRGRSFPWLEDAPRVVGEGLESSTRRGDSVRELHAKRVSCSGR